MADDEAKQVLGAYKKKFNRLPDQPHHLIAFSKSRSDLPNLNYRNAKGVIEDSKKNKANLNNKPHNDMQIAQEKDLPSSPKVKKQQQKQKFIENNDEGNHDEGLLSEDDDNDDDALYHDGNETTAPGFVAQMAMQENAVANGDQFDYITPKVGLGLDDNDESNSLLNKNNN
eukprot:944604_1